MSTEIDTGPVTSRKSDASGLIGIGRQLVGRQLRPDDAVVALEPPPEIHQPAAPGAEREVRQTLEVARRQRPLAGRTGRGRLRHASPQSFFPEFLLLSAGFEASFFDEEESLDVSDESFDSVPAVFGIERRL